MFIQHNCILSLYRFIYCDECSLSGENVLPVLYASKKYLLPILTQLCTKFLEDNLHIDNVCVIYEQCLHFDEATILDKCRDFIETRTKEIFASDTFRDLSRIYQFLEVSYTIAVITGCAVAPALC